jgi:hypothetical protein
MITNKDSFVHVEKGISIYLIEYILLYHYGYVYANGGDPHQDTQYKTTDISDGTFHFSLYDHNENEKYISPVGNPEYIQGDYFFNGIMYECFSAKKILRNYKIKKLENKITNYV